MQKKLKKKKDKTSPKESPSSINNKAL